MMARAALKTSITSSFLLDGVQYIAAAVEQKLQDQANY